MSDLVEVRRSPIHGRGLFAAAAIRKNALIAAAPLLIFTASDTRRILKTRLGHYIFWIDETAKGDWICAVAFGPISLCNHSPKPNAWFEIDEENEEVLLHAARGVRAGEEITIDYGPEEGDDGWDFDTSATV